MKTPDLGPCAHEGCRAPRVLYSRHCETHTIMAAAENRPSRAERLNTALQHNDLHRWLKDNPQIARRYRENHALAVITQSGRGLADIIICLADYITAQQEALIAEAQRKPPRFFIPTDALEENAALKKRLEHCHELMEKARSELIMATNQFDPSCMICGCQATADGSRHGQSCIITKLAAEVAKP